MRIADNVLVHYAALHKINLATYSLRASLLDSDHRPNVGPTHTHTGDAPMAAKTRKAPKGQNGSAGTNNAPTEVKPDRDAQAAIRCQI